MAKNDFQYGGWNIYILQCGTIMTLISSGDCTLQYGMWLWNRHSKFTKWQHPAMLYVTLGWHAIEFARRQHPAVWHVALESLHWIHQVAAPCSAAGGSGITCHWIRPNVRHIGILHMVSISTTSSQSTCHSTTVSDILSKSDHPWQKKMTSCRFSRWRISSILDFRGPIMGSLKSLCATSYRSSIDTVALNCLVFEKIAILHVGVKMQNGGSSPSWILGDQWLVLWKAHVRLPVVNRDHSSKLLSYWENDVFFAFWRQTNRQTNRWTPPMH